MEQIFLYAHKEIYLSLFALTVVEGPISSFIAALMAGQGMLNILYVFLIALAGDVTGDLFLYFAGRFGPLIFQIKPLQGIKKWYQKKRNCLTHDKRIPFKKTLEKHLFWYMFAVKVTPYLSSPGLFYLGTRRIKFRVFALYSTFISILVKCIYLIPAYLGAITLRQMQHVLTGRKYIALFVISAVFLFWLVRILYGYMSASVEKKVEETTEKDLDIW